MRRAAALGVVMATVVAVQQVTPDLVPAPTAALAMGFALIAASLLGDLAERVKLPRLSGYLVFGLLCGPYLLNLITSSMARELQVINGLAIALIAFVAGLEINLARLRERLGAILTVGGVTLAVMYVLLLALFLVAWPWLPVAPDAGGLERLAMAAVLTILVVSFSPTISLAVIAECRARGPLTELVLAVVVLADLVLIFAFTLAMQFARWATGGALPGDVSLLTQLLWEIGGSLAFGALVGGLFALYLRAIGREITIMLLALCAVVSVGGTALHFEPLLAALAAGLVVENIAPPRGDALRDAVERSAMPVLVIFFAAAGASLQVDALATIGLTAAALAAARLVTMRIGSRLGRHAAGLADPSSSLMWMGLVSQAGVTLGLVIIVANEFEGWGAAIQTIVVAMIALHVLTGPILFRSALARAGEIGRLDEPAPAAGVRPAFPGN